VREEVLASAVEEVCNAPNPAVATIRCTSAAGHEGDHRSDQLGDRPVHYSPAE
jgi:hypothetical protein